MESARRSGPALQTSLGLGVGPQPPGEGHAESHAGRQRQTDGSAAAQVLGTLPLWVALGSCLAARGHVTGNGDTQTPPAHSPCSERTLTSSRGAALPSLPSWASLTNKATLGAPAGPFRENEISVCSHASGQNREAGP